MNKNMSEYELKRFVLKAIKMEDYRKEYRLREKLPNYTHQVLIGLILSDGSLERPTSLGGVRFSINLSEKDISFMLHIYNILEPYVDTGPRIRELKIKDKEYNTVGIKTVILPSLINYYIQFYKYEEKKKK